jgi:DNA mismatch repair protein MutS2
MKEQDYYSGPPAPDELRLRYLTVDEALPRVEKFLHDAYVAGFQQIKIIHGKGSGTLRLLVRRELGRHSLVKSFRAGENWEGGEGVTIVEFSEK